MLSNEEIEVLRRSVVMSPPEHPAPLSRDKALELLEQLGSERAKTRVYASALNRIAAALAEAKAAKDGQ